MISTRLNACWCIVHLLCTMFSSSPARYQTRADNVQSIIFFCSQGVLLGLSNTAGVLAGVIGTYVTGQILQTGTCWCLRSTEMVCDFLGLLTLMCTKGENRLSWQLKWEPCTLVARLLKFIGVAFHCFGRIVGWCLQGCCWAICSRNHCLEHPSNRREGLRLIGE